MSYFEADAYANWDGARLPTEFEWEHAASELPIEGNFVDTERFHPAPVAARVVTTKLQQMFGDVWEWTRSAYLPYPGYRAGPGALGEYNGKFMCNQMVLRGGSCATSRESHPPDLPEFLSAGKTLAVHRHPAGPRPGMSGPRRPGRTCSISSRSSEDFLAEVVAGLSSSPRSLPCKFFYDERGAELFQKICELPEYYITRTETELLRRHGAEMAESIGANAELIGFGTGAGVKTRMLLEHLENPIAYVPVDISKQRLTDSAAELSRAMPALEILPVCADYLQPLRIADASRKPDSRRRLFSRLDHWESCEPEVARHFLTSRLPALRQERRANHRRRSAEDRARFWRRPTTTAPA